jgi:ADP-ribose pyrophosphatase YjhB (NUDIX family)
MTQIIDHAVVGTIIEKDGLFLLVRETKKGREGMYNVPGGHVEPHETLLEAAIRETHEESGYEVEITGLLGVYQTIRNSINVSGPVFLARVIGGEALTSTVHPEVIWVTPEKLSKLADSGKLFTTYPPHAVKSYLDGKVLPLDTFVCDRA